MIVELLQVTVRPEQCDAFVSRNVAAWGAALSERPGFIRQETLARQDRPDEVIVLVYWRSRDDMDAFPEGEKRRLDSLMSDMVLRQQVSLLELVGEVTIAE